MVVALSPFGGAASPPEVLRLTVAPAETLSVSLAGHGDPVVIVPGLLGAAFGFRKVTAALVDAGYRVVVVEPLGTGASSRPKAADYSLTRQSERVEAVLDTLGIRGALLLCHSVGASVGLRLALRRPELVAGIVSINGGPAEEAGTAGLRFALKFAPLLKLLGGSDFVRRKIHEELRRNSGDPAWVTEEVIESYTAPFAADFDGTLDALRGMVSSREPYALLPRLEQLAAPVLLLVGGDRSTLSPEEVAALATRLPTLLLDSIPGAGDYIHEERPAVVVAAVQRLHRGRAAPTRAPPVRPL